MDFPKDPWLLFTHWTHRTYPYGPVFLLLTLIPSFLAFSKLILNIILFKVLYISFYLSAVYVLKKINTKYALFFATNPYILIEGLINAHNDFIALCITIIAIYFLSKKNAALAYGLFLLSGGIKYITLPALFLKRQLKDPKNIIIFILTVAIILLISYRGDLQQWYFLNILIFLPFMFRFIQRIHIFLFGLLISYYPYIRYNGWVDVENVIMKKQIIFLFAFFNVIYLLSRSSRINKNLVLFRKIAFDFFENKSDKRYTG